jgi:hypothetical protein
VRVLYPISDYVASFDFTNWMVENKSRFGMTHVVFDVRNPKTNKWTPQQVWGRLQSILIPAALLGGLTVSIGTDGVKTSTPYMTGFVKWWRDGGRFDRIESPMKGTDSYTVTLRKTQRSPNRDSDEEVWREFAKRIGARVIEDFDVQPISLFERFSIYAGAKMNYGICNGPLFMLTLSPYPVAMFAAVDSDSMHRKAKLKVGEPFPWALPNQYLIEKKPTVEDLMKFHEEHCV